MTRSKTSKKRLPPRWAELSPLLDQMFDLAEDARRARMREIVAVDPALAASLAGLFESAARPAHAGFMEDSVAPAAWPTPGLVGRRIGPYEVDAELGEGSGGSVWRAHVVGEDAGRPVALKLLHLSCLGRRSVARFDRERAMLGRLGHRNIARLLGSGVTPQGQPYLAMECIDGVRIDEHCDAQRLDVAARLRLVRQVMDAVMHVHAHGIVHRDLKASNVLVTRDGVVKLLDFGIAKLLSEPDASNAHDPVTLTGQMPMTPRYAAPEQIRGGAVTQAADVYALGVLMYRLLCGRHPTTPDESTAADINASVLTRKPLAMSAAAMRRDRVGEESPEAIAANRGGSLAQLRRTLTRDLNTIVARALRKEPAARHASVAAFATALDRCRAHEAIAASRDAAGVPGPRRPASTLAWWAASASARPAADRGCRH